MRDFWSIFMRECSMALILHPFGELPLKKEALIQKFIANVASLLFQRREFKCGLELIELSCDLIQNDYTTIVLYNRKKQ